MAWFCKLGFFDIGKWYENGPPIFTGSVFSPPPPSPGPGSAIPIETVSTTPQEPYLLPFVSEAVPPDDGALLVTDTSTPGDIFRSGPLRDWPPGPDPINPAFLTIVTSTTTTLLTNNINTLVSRIALPPVQIPLWVSILISTITLGLFVPLSITLTSITPVVGAAPLTFMIRGTFVAQQFYFFRRTSPITYTFTITIRPSGDPTDRTRVFAVGVTSTILSIAGGGIANVLIRPLIDRLVAPLLERMINQMTATTADDQLKELGLRRTPSAVLNARNVVVLPSGIAIQIAVSDLLDKAITKIPRNINVTVSPTAKANVRQNYQFTVTYLDSGMPVRNATTTLHNFDAHGIHKATTKITDGNGIAEYRDVILRTHIVHQTSTNNKVIEVISPTFHVNASSDHYAFDMTLLEDFTPLKRKSSDRQEVTQDTQNIEPIV